MGGGGGGAQDKFENFMIVFPQYILCHVATVIAKSEGAISPSGSGVPVFSIISQRKMHENFTFKSEERESFCDLLDEHWYATEKEWTCRALTVRSRSSHSLPFLQENDFYEKTSSARQHEMNNNTILTEKNTKYDETSSLYSPLLPNSSSAKTEQFKGGESKLFRFPATMNQKASVSEFWDLAWLNNKFVADRRISKPSIS